MFLPISISPRQNLLPLFCAPCTAAMLQRKAAGMLGNPTTSCLPTPPRPQKGAGSTGSSPTTRLRRFPPAGVSSTRQCQKTPPRPGGSPPPKPVPAGRRGGAGACASESPPWSPDRRHPPLVPAFCPPRNAGGGFFGWTRTPPPCFVPAVRSRPSRPPGRGSIPSLVRRGGGVCGGGCCRGRKTTGRFVPATATTILPSASGGAATLTTPRGVGGPRTRYRRSRSWRCGSQQRHCCCCGCCRCCQRVSGRSSEPTRFRYASLRKRECWCCCR
mmetsp:Transcript_24262/g.51550  ORF Transcript_24262/g.51550 Transcript_24262/m.51550 type:complete len:272 (-) Transcript_24262:382-1197(-)